MTATKIDVAFLWNFVNFCAFFGNFFCFGLSWNSSSIEQAIFSHHFGSILKIRGLREHNFYLCEKQPNDKQFGHFQQKWIHHPRFLESAMHFSKLSMSLKIGQLGKFRREYYENTQEVLEFPALNFFWPHSWSHVFWPVPDKGSKHTKQKLNQICKRQANICKETCTQDGLEASGNAPWLAKIAQGHAKINLIHQREAPKEKICD